MRWAQLNVGFAGMRVEMLYSLIMVALCNRADHYIFAL